MKINIIQIYPLSLSLFSKYNSIVTTYYYNNYYYYYITIYKYIPHMFQVKSSPYRFYLVIINCVNLVTYKAHFQKRKEKTGKISKFNLSIVLTFHIITSLIK